VTASSRHGSRLRRSWLIALALAALLALSACATMKSSSGTASSGSTASSGTASITSKWAPGSDVGLTKTTIRVAMIADVNVATDPGQFTKSVNAVKAWASNVNASGGLAGRKVIVDFCDSQEDVSATTNCVIKACQQDFALVGTEALVLSDFSDIDSCKDAAGQAVGIPNLAGIALPPGACDADTYLAFNTTGLTSYCATRNDNPQTYTVNDGDFRYYESIDKFLHGIWLYNGDIPILAQTSVPQYTVANGFGIGKDGQGFYTSNAESPQSSLTSDVNLMKAKGSTFAYDGVTPSSMVLLRREAQLQGVASVKVWACNEGCYDSSFLSQGGSAVNGTYAPINNLPFYTEYKSNASLAALAKAIGGVNNLDNNALQAYVAALLFQDAVTKATGGGGTLNRQTLFTAIRDEHSFTADGIIGPTDIGDHALSACIVLTQVVNGQWQRVYPAKPGTFDCNPANISQIKMNVSQ
jgi:ABC-type branched-subunit amino acid transport system substrate-binding protein